MKGSSTCVSRKKQFGETVGLLTKGWLNALTDNKQKTKIFNAFFAYVCIRFPWQSLLLDLHLSTMTCEGEGQTPGGATNEGLPREAVSIQIRVTRWDSPEGADVTVWLQSITRKSQGQLWQLESLPLYKNWANTGWMNKLLYGLKICWIIRSKNSNQCCDRPSGRR